MLSDGGVVITHDFEIIDSTDIFNFVFTMWLRILDLSYRILAGAGIRFSFNCFRQLVFDDFFIQNSFISNYL